MIVDAAAELDADPIAMGKYGHRGAGRLLLGSLAESVLRLSNIPILTLRDAIGRRRRSARFWTQVGSRDEKVALGSERRFTSPLANDRPRLGCGAFCLMGHEHRKWHRFDHRSSHATEHPFERPCVTVGTEHEQVGMHSARLAQKRCAGVHA